MSEQPNRTDLTNKSYLTAIFTDYDDSHSPYEGLAVKISLTGETLFIYVGQLAEDVGKDTFKANDDQVIGVEAQQFYETLGAMLRRDDRRNAARAQEGSLSADDPAWTSTPLVTHLPATRRRA